MDMYSNRGQKFRKLHRRHVTSMSWQMCWKKDVLIFGVYTTHLNSMNISEKRLGKVSILDVSALSISRSYMIQPFEKDFRSLWELSNNPPPFSNLHWAHKILCLMFNRDMLDCFRCTLAALHNLSMSNGKSESCGLGAKTHPYPFQKIQSLLIA